ncbi:MAG: GAF domain-containing protein [Anaerolineales bacterium]
MSDNDTRGRAPRVLVLADVASNAQAIIDRTLEPGGLQAWVGSDPQAPTADVLVVDVTQLRGDPLASLRARRNAGDEAPAIVLAARIPTAHLRDLFRLGVADMLLKPYKGVELCQAIYELSEARAGEVTTQLLARRLQTTREQARRRSEEIRWLSEIGRTVVHLGDLDQIFARLTEAAAFLTGAEESNLYLVQPHSREVVLRASKAAGQSKAALKRLRLSDTLAGQVVRTNKPIIRQPDLDEPMVKVQTGFLVQSLVKVPIRVGDRVAGVLGVYNRLAPRTFSDHHVTLLNALADWAGVALENAERAESEPEPPAASGPDSVLPTPDSDSLVQAPPALIAGLDDLQQELTLLLDGAARDSNEPLRNRLRFLRDQLRGLAKLPIVVLDPELSHGFIDLTELVERVVDELRMAAHQRNLELVVEGDHRIPRLRGDRNRAHRVIEALTTAAIRRTNRGRIALSIHRFEIKDGHSTDHPIPSERPISDGLWVAVHVDDSSGGLSPDTVRALAAPRPDPQAGRLGPGLSMGEIRMIAESMGGHLWHHHAPSMTSLIFALPAR